MDTAQTVILALVQGLTEFLPISSSAHLILVPVIFGWTDQGLAFDVAVHIGSLAAVLTYFARDLRRMLAGWLASVSGAGLTAEGRLAWAIVVGSVPVIVVGLYVNSHADALRDPVVIAAATAAFALALWWADRGARVGADEHELSWTQVLCIGLAQVLALIPGTSRSGITITAGLALGLSRRAASRFSFLLAIPVILAAGSLKTYELATLQDPTPWGPVVLGAVVAGIAAYTCIHWFLKLVERVGMLPFVVYRLVLAAVLFLIYL